MILIEGPDNSGKSTLLKQLKKDLKLHQYSRPHGPPKTKDELLGRAISIALVQEENRLIIDRHPILGEIIYGPILRSHNKWDEMSLEFKALSYILLKGIQTGKVFLVYCRPPDKILLNFKTHQVKEYDTPEHIRSLEKNAKEIVKMYDKMIEPIANHVYNYTDTKQYQYLLNHIRGEYLNERE